MNLSDFSGYTTEDFVLNDSFQAYVWRTNEADINFWQTWILYHPEKEEAFYQAVTLVKELRKPAYTVPAQVKKQEYDRLIASITAQQAPGLEEQGVVIPLSGRQPNLDFNWRLLAASLTGLLVLATVVIFIFSKKTVADTRYQTAFGEIRKVVLPDSSEVVLNSNSTLVIPGDWQEGKPRTAWVQGEAYFSVTHKKNKQSFTVTTSKGMCIEVLGTQFNVSDRKYRNSVVLKTGKIKLALQPEGQAARSLVMAPGDLVEVKPQTGLLTRVKVNPDKYISWKERVLVFEDATLAEISAQLQESYGISVKITDASLLHLPVSGVASTLDLEGFLTGLSKLHHFKIRKESKTLYLGS